MSKCTSGPSFSTSVLNTQKRVPKGVQEFEPEPLGSLKGTQYRYQNQVQGTRTQYKVREVRGARCKFGLQMQGKRFQKVQGTRYTVHKGFEQAPLQPLITRRTRKRGGGFRVFSFSPHFGSFQAQAPWILWASKWAGNRWRTGSAKRLGFSAWVKWGSGILPG